MIRSYDAGIERNMKGDIYDRDEAIHFMTPEQAKSNASLCLTSDFSRSVAMVITLFGRDVSLGSGARSKQTDFTEPASHRETPVTSHVGAVPQP